MEKRKILSEEAVKLFYGIVLHGEGPLIAYENNKIAHIKTRETVPIHTLYPNGIDPADLKRR